MSHYRKILTTLSKGTSLVQALQELHLAPLYGADLQANSQVLHNGYDRDQEVAVLIPSEQLVAAGYVQANSYGGRALFGGGLGYRWDGQAGTYGAVMDGMDDHRLFGFQAALTQRYAVVEAKAAAEADGWFVTESAQADGTVELVCQKY